MNWVNAAVQGVLLGGLYALFACGLSLMFGVMRIVNLAHGDLAVLAAFLASTAMTTLHVNVTVAAVVVVPAFAVLGYLLQRGLLRRSLTAGPFATLLVTFGLSVVIQNVLLETYSADSRSLSTGSFGSASLHVSGQISVAYLSLLTFGLAAVVLVALQVFLSRTGLGRIMRATSDDPEAARLVGDGVATALAFATVALAGLLFAMRS